MIKKIIIVVVVIGLIIGGRFLIMNNKDTPAPSPTPTATTPSPSDDNEPTPTFTYNAGTSTAPSGFAPTGIFVQSGDKIAVKNATTNNIDIQSNPHPVHTDNTELNVGVIAPGQTKTFVLTKKGTFVFHNHLIPFDTGTVVVQ